MPRPRLPDRVVGAYPDDKRRPDGPWSVVLVLDGRRVTERAAGESEARRLEARYRRDLSTEVRTAQDALEEWITWKAATIKPVSVAALRSSLPRFLGPVLGLPLTALRGKAEDLYARAVSLFAVVTQRLALQRAKEWGAWLVRKRWLTVNPFAHVEPVGRPNVGKPQLREDEAALFLQKALEIWDAGRTWAAIPAVLLLLGTRVSETQAVEVRDLDRGGAVLWIAKSKTDAGKRRLAVPDVLRERLLRLAEGKGPHELRARLLGAVAPSLVAPYRLGAGEAHGPRLPE